VKTNEEADESPTEKNSELVGERVRIFVRGGTWHANFQEDGRQVRRSLKTSNKKTALRKARALDAELVAGTHKEATKPASITEVITAYDLFLVCEGRSNGTLDIYRRVFRLAKELAVALGVKRIDEIDIRFIDAYRAMRKDAGLAAKTIYTELTVLRQLVNFALSRKMVAADPLAGLRLKKPKPTQQPCWTRAEIQTILAASLPESRPVFELLAETGVRIGELIHLTWDDVDVANNVIRIRPKQGWKPKSGDQRAVPMSRRVGDLLSQLPRRGEWIFTAAVTTRHPKPGRMMSPRRLLKSLKRVLKRLGLPGHLHTFRHSFISAALMGGTPEAVVREWVGHVDRDILRLYTHVANAASQAAMKALDAKSQAAPEAEAADRASGTNSAQNQHSSGTDGK
jgi:integrase